MSKMLLLGVGGSSRPNFTSNLVGYWRLDEASGNAIDSFGSLDLTDTNTVGSGTGHVAAAARDFEVGSAEYFTRADEAAFEVGAQSWSACGWINHESTPASHHNLISKFDANADAGSGRGWKLHVDSGNALVVVNKDGTNSTTLTHGTALSSATWYFVAGGYDASVSKNWCSVNAGTRALGSVVAISHNDETYSFRIGRVVNGSAGVYWDGLMEQWGLWIGRVLTDVELTYIYNAGVGRVLV